MDSGQDNPTQLPALDLRNSSDGGKGPLGNQYAGKMLYVGSDREELVETLQSMLVKLGYDVGSSGVDGKFGNDTEKAVKQFQEENKDWNGDGLKVDGLIGPKTSDALNRAMVGLWYDHYQTPVELTEDYALLTATAEALNNTVSVEIEDEVKGRVILTTPVPKQEPPKTEPPKKEPPPSYADQDMWAKKGDDIASSGLKVKYEEKDGNYVQWLQDGAKAMFEMCDAFCQASRFIWFIASYFSPGINIARGPDYDKIKAKYPSIIDKVSQLNKSKGIAEDKVPLVSLLTVKAEEGVNVRIVLFRPDFAQNLGGGPFGWEEAWQIISDWSAGKIDLQLAMWGGTYEGHEIGGHHQKSAIVGLDDKLIAFCGGVDMAYARWALPSHSSSDPIDAGTVDQPVKIDDQMGWIDPSAVLGEWNDEEKEYRTKGSQIFWHDVHTKLVGPAAANLADNFVERYVNAKSSDDVFKPDVDQEPDFLWLKSNYERLSKEEGSKDLIDSEDSYSSAKAYAQILRSYYTSDDYGIWDAYRNLFRKAKKNIYIESQYAFEDANYGLFGVDGCFETLRDALKANNELKVIIAAPVMPDSYDSDIIKNLRELVRTSFTDPKNHSTARVTVYSLVTNIDRDSGSKRVPIYVHVKIAVVDDEWAIVGSANLDRMGMGGKGGGWGSRGSSEIAILVHGQPQALALRGTVVKEHLGSGSPSDTDSFDDVFNSFKDVASKNGRPRDNKALTGQVVFHRLYNDI